MNMNTVRCATLVLVALFGAALLQGMPPPRRPDGKLPEAFLERREENPAAFTYRDSLIGQVKTIQKVRAAAATRLMTQQAVEAAGGIAIEGQRFIPVLPILFHNTAAEPYPVSNLQQELFDGPFATGTMKDYYLEVSYNRLTVDGKVRSWQRIARDDTFYQGPDFIGSTGKKEPCYGLCKNAGTGELLKEALEANDAAVDFGAMDNDGPDGIPNSGDDNGVADFVAFVHPEVGGECDTDQTITGNIWSHRWSYQDWHKGKPFVTNDPKAGGGFIRVNDYVIMPALACDGSTMIQIGVFAHEFGHAFGLPDLYDTDDSNGESEGVGNWCLMGSGSWGGDGSSPERPAHLSAWAKAQLGWIFPVLVENAGEFQPARVTDSERAPLAYRIPISKTQYYLVENRQRVGFDGSLLGAGLLVWKINEEMIKLGESTNSVNADEDAKGVELIQADGLNDLNGVGNRGDAGDVFAGLTLNRFFHNSSRPRSFGRVAICDIGDPDVSDQAMSATLLATSGACPVPVSPTPASAAAANSAEMPVAAPGTDWDASMAPSVKALQEDPERFLDRTVRIKGTLINAGGKYFDDKARRIVIRDSQGNEVDVQPWIPLSFPPGRRGEKKSLSSYLDKVIEIVGKVERLSRDGKESFVLTVDSAEVVPPPL